MVFFKKGEFKLLWPFYLASLIGYLSDATDFIFVIFFLQKGFGLFDISALLAITAAGVFFLEIPTGAIADSFGKKKSVITGWILGGISYALLPFATNFIQAGIIMLVFTFAVSLISGAYESWVYDYLAKKRKKDLAQSFFINESSIQSAGLLVAGLIGTAIIVFINMDLLFVIAGIGMILGGLILLKVPSTESTEKVKKITYKKLLKNSVDSLKYAKKHPVIRNLLIGSAFMTLGAIAAVAWQPYLISEGIAEATLPLLGSIGAFIAIFLPHTIRYVEHKKISAPKYLSAMVLLGGIALILIYFIPGIVYAFISFLLIRTILPKITSPLEEKYFQDHTKSSIRATTTSLQMMVIGIPAFIGLLIGGAVAELLGPVNALALSGIAILPAAYFYYKAKKK